MLDILVLFVLGRSIATKAREKGRSPVGYVILLVVLWYGGIFAGVIAGGIVSMVLNGGGEPDEGPMILGALGCGVIGVLIAFGVVSAIAPVQASGRYDDDYDDDRPRRRDRDDRW
jgi:hypothetical protein